MLAFPFEYERCDEIGFALSKEVQAVNRWYSFWLTSHKEKHLTGLPIVQATATVAIDVQACRQFRTAVDLCMRGEAECAHIIVRSLFETVLATAFLWLPIVRIRPTPILDKQTKTLKLDNKGHPRFRTEYPKKGSRRLIPSLDRLMRAKLLAANSFLQDYMQVQSISNSPGRKRISTSLKSNIPTTLISDVEREVGPEWLSCMLQAGNYSGLSIATLAGELRHRLDYWYDVIYRMQSRHTHSAFIHGNMKSQSTDQVQVAWFSPTDKVRGTMHLAMALFLIHISILDDELGLGWGTSQVLSSFRKEHHQLMSGKLN